MITAEQQARDMLDRLGVPDAQTYSSGDLVELANLIAEVDMLRRKEGDMVIDNEPTADWEVSVKLHVNDDGGRKPTDTVVSVTGTWTPDGQRPMDECIALDMATIIKMLQAGGNVIAPGDAKSVIQAVDDAWS